MLLSLLAMAYGEYAMKKSTFLNGTVSSKEGEMWCSQLETICCFFSHKGIVHYQLIAQEQMMNQQYYLQVLTRLWDSPP
jgi:hypothetical protein